MLVAFDNLSDDARIWVYQSNRQLTAEEIAIASEKLDGFVANWTRHGSDLKGAYAILQEHFIVLGVDDAVSGCSIDASVHAIQELEQLLQLDLTNKMNISFKDGDNINIVSLGDFQKYAAQNKITGDTIVFNNMVGKKIDLTSKWEVKAEDSWHKRYLMNS